MNFSESQKEIGAVALAAGALVVVALATDHSSLMRIAVGWLLRAMIVYAVWVMANGAFSRTRTPWATALRIAGAVVGFALFVALVSTPGACDGDAVCQADMSAPPTARDSFLLIILLAGVPSLAAAIRHRAVFSSSNSAHAAATAHRKSDRE